MLYLLVFLTVGGGSFNLNGVCYSFVVGSQPLLKEYIGFHLMWFLPAYFALTLIKSLWYNSGKLVRAICLAISIAIWGLSLFGVLDMSQIGRYAPFSLSEGFAYLLLGLATRKMLEAFSVKVLWPCAMAGIVVLSIMYYFCIGIGANLYYFARLLMPLFVFIVLYAIRDFLAKSRFLKFFGRYSLQIYLTHVLVINVLMTGLLHFTKESIPVGILILFLSLAISSGIAVVIDKIAFLKKMLFPLQNHGSN